MGRTTRIMHHTPMVARLHFTRVLEDRYKMNTSMQSDDADIYMGIRPVIHLHHETSRWKRICTDLY